MSPFLKRNWFLCSLVVLFATGFTLHTSLGQLVEMSWLKKIIVAIVMFMMALPLNISAMVSGIRQPKGTILACLINYGALPFCAWMLSPLITNESIRIGFLVASVTPCTLASASVWTRKAGGNDAVSLMVTIVTNTACFLVTPAWLSIMLAGGKELNTPTGQIMMNLCLLVVLPMVIAQLVRLHRPWAEKATARKKHFSTLAQCGILSIVFLGAIKAGDLLLESADTGALPVTALAVSIAFVIIVHSVMFWFGYGCGALIRLPRADQIAVAFSGSQKTLMVGLYLCDLLECIAIPMIAFHVCQLFIDTLFADRLNRSGQIDPNDRPREQQHKHSPSSGGEDADKGEDMFSDLE